jgi:cobalt transporter subunit CbtA
MLIRVLLTAIFAGVIAGAFTTAAQSWRVIPLILEAERYEETGHSHGHGDHSHGDENPAPDEKQDGAKDWKPSEGFERSFYTMLSNIIAGVAFSMILTAGILLARQEISLKSGLVWGGCGFVAFVLAPNFGLPPELPGMAGGELRDRQVWWLATVVCTCAALWIFAFKRGLIWMGAGLLLVLLPHIYGAPQPDSHTSAVPAHLAAEFAVATMVTSALFWLFLGGVLGFLLDRIARTHGEAGQKG